MEKLYALQIREIISTTREEGWAFIFICLYLFFEYVRPQTVYPLIDAIPWVPIVLCLSFVALLLRGPLEAQSNILNKLIVCYALVVMLSSVFSQYPSISFAQWRTFFDWFFIYFLIVQIVNNEKRFFIFLLSFLLYSLKMSQHGFLTWMQRNFTFDSWGVTGAPGWFQNSGEVGIQMCIYVPLAVAFILATHKVMSKPKLLFFLCMPFTGIATAIGSSSRGALVGLAIAGIRPLLIKPRSFIIGVMVLSAVAAITIATIPDESIKRFHAAGSDRTSLHRLERWQDGLDSMQKYPLLGVGFEAWTKYYPNHYELKDKGTLLVPNIFVRCGSELGYAGLSIFIFMILACFTNTKKVRNLNLGQDDQFLTIMSYGFDAALLGYLGSGFFVTVLYYPYFWIHCAMTVCLRSAALKKSTQMIDSVNL